MANSVSFRPIQMAKPNSSLKGILILKKKFAWEFTEKISNRNNMSYLPISIVSQEEYIQTDFLK